MGFCSSRFRASRDETWIARFWLNALLGDFQIHFHPLVEVAVGDIAECFAVGFRHSGGHPLDHVELHLRIEAAVNVQPYQFVIRFERIAMIGFLTEVRENLLKYFPVDTPVE